MFSPRSEDIVRFEWDERPLVLVVVDTEEEFDWEGAFSSSATSVKSIRHQEPAQRILERHGIIPTYVVDYPVASQDEGYKPLGEFLADGKCAIGAHLHPWVNPPIEEDISAPNSYPGNLPKRLETEKLRRLTSAIEENFDVGPTVYKAGRYGAGANTADILAELGYKVDMSVCPHTDLRPRHGPDFSRCTANPYWFGPDRGLLEIPLTVGMVGLLSAMGSGLYPMVSTPLGKTLKIPAVLSRLGLLERIPLTPEGTSLAEAKRLTRALLARGHRVFTITYHSPSLEPGHTPYVRSREDLDAFLAWLDEYLGFFLKELGGQSTTPAAVRERALRLRARPDPGSPVLEAGGGDRPPEPPRDLRQRANSQDSARGRP